MSTKSGTTTRQKKVVLLVIAALFMVTLACSVETGPAQKTPNDTEIARSVEETLAAEQAQTGQPRQTEDNGIQQTIEAQQATLEAQTNLISQQATIDAQSTLLAQPSAISSAPLDTAVPTDSPIAGSEKPFALKDWKPSSLRQAPGCGEDSNGPPCWFGKADELVLTLEKPVLIDSAWPNPHLVFSQRYYFVQNATIYIKDDGSWKVLWSFPSGQNSNWQPVQIDLSPYKGKQILFRFIVSGTSGSLYRRATKNEWYIRDPQINPNYSPY